jgi:tetratricopeptide (TPR) repeat protein
MRRREGFRNPIPWLIALACWIAGTALAAGMAPPEPSGGKADVQSLIDAAKAEGRQFKSSQPQPAWEASAARKQIEALWAYSRERPTTPEGSRATLAALQILSDLGRHAEAREKIDTLGIQEPVWADVMWILLQRAEQSGSFDDFVAKAKWVIANTQDADLATKLWFTLGRYYRQNGQLIEAEAAYQKAAGSPDPKLVELSQGAIYEMWSLNPGQAAPVFTAPLLSGETLSLEKLRGKVVVLDFWGSA